MGMKKAATRPVAPRPLDDTTLAAVRGGDATGVFTHTPDKRESDGENVLRTKFQS
jgi:hypothetical protein